MEPGCEILGNLIDSPKCCPDRGVKSVTEPFVLSAISRRLAFFCATGEIILSIRSIQL